MSRGWESKAVEEQQAEQAADRTVNVSAGAANQQTDAERTRRRRDLELQRERILSERTSSPHRRSALSNALASVEEELAQLGWMLHL